MTKKVVIIQRVLKNYRIAFLNSLKENLQTEDIELLFIYGEDDLIVFDNAEVDWGIKIKNSRYKIFGKKFYYQPVIKYIKDADLIIVEQATKYIINYLLLLLRLMRLKKVAFWGHGINFQSDNPNSISEFVKKTMTRNVDWFFAYTNLSKKIIEEMGFPSKRITTVYNTINNQKLVEEKRKWSTEDLVSIKLNLNIKSDKICLFIGGIYREKKINFLVDALLLIKKSVPDFEFIFIGDGPERKIVENISNKVDWIHFVGAKFDKQKVPYFMISKLLLIPGLIGLTIVDSFVFETPLVTTDCKGHGPEIDYLSNGSNGIMTKTCIDSFSQEIIKLLNDENQLQILVNGCAKSAKLYTMQKMVDNFSNGIIQCLEI